jgi:Ras-related protein Rab-7A
MDMVNETRSHISEQEALRFLDELVPPSSPRFEPEDEADDLMSASQLTARIPGIGMPMQTPRLAGLTLDSPPTSIALSVSPSYSQFHSFSYSGSGPNSQERKHARKSRSRSSSRFPQGTMTTTRTSLTIYHTPSSSLFDVYQSARASPEPSSHYASYRGRSSSASPTRASRRMASGSSTSSGSMLTLTPALFARRQSRIAVTTPPASSPDLSLPSLPERRPKLFFTSAKTGEGVSDVFEYITRRVVMRWEHEEGIEARVVHGQDARETVRLGLEGKGAWSERHQGSCCSS